MLKQRIIKLSTFFVCLSAGKVFTEHMLPFPLSVPFRISARQNEVLSFSLICQGNRYVGRNQISP